MRARVSRAVALAALLATTAVAGCGAEQDPFVLPEDEAEQYATAYLLRVEPAPSGDDLVDGGGEYVVIANNADIRVDMGGWYIDDAAGNRLNLGIGRQIRASPHPTSFGRAHPSARLASRCRTQPM